MPREMKNSGIEWIGEIPVGWEVRKLKQLTDRNLQYGMNAEGIEFSNNLPRYIRITDITADNRLKDFGKQSQKEELSKSYILQDGDILFARSGGTVGKTFLFKEEYGYACFAGYLIRFQTDSMQAHPHFI